MLKSQGYECPELPLRARLRLTTPRFLSFLRDLSLRTRLDRLTATASPAEAAAERSPGTLDSAEEDGGVATAPQEDLRDEEQYILEQLPLPGEPNSEGARRKARPKVPLRVRIAIRRLHRQYCPNRAPIQLMRLSRMASEYIEAVMVHRCKSCELRKPP